MVSAPSPLDYRGGERREREIQGERMEERDGGRKSGSEMVAGLFDRDLRGCGRACTCGDDDLEGT